MLRFMLDTDICSYIIKRSSPSVLKHLQKIPPAEVCISAISNAELLYGVQISPRREIDGAAVDAFLRHIDVVPFCGDAGAHYAQIRAELKRRGAMIGAHDLFIAAHARSMGLNLVTNNIREFRRVGGLSVENWVGRTP